MPLISINATTSSSWQSGSTASPDVGHLVHPTQRHALKFRQATQDLRQRRIVERGVLQEQFFEFRQCGEFRQGFRRGTLLTASGVVVSEGTRASACESTRRPQRPVHWPDPPRWATHFRPVSRLPPGSENALEHLLLRGQRNLSSALRRGGVDCNHAGLPGRLRGTAGSEISLLTAAHQAVAESSTE